MTYIDVLTNERLVGTFAMSRDIADELARVASLIERYATTGEDLSYWFERERILRKALA